jgi:uncharacterized protein YfaS (alpha-2-macroglobulin family)
MKIMNREENITNIDWDNQIFETEDGSVLPFVVDEEINVLTENLNSADGVIYVYNPQNDNEEK